MLPLTELTAATYVNMCASLLLTRAIGFLVQRTGWISARTSGSNGATGPLSGTISSHCRPRISALTQLYNHRASPMRSVPRETAKQLDFKMKFMGLAVVFMVLNLAASAPAPVFTPAVAAAFGNVVGAKVALGLTPILGVPAIGAAAIAGALPAGFVTGTLLPGKIVGAKALTLIGIGAAGIAANRG